MGTEIQSQNDIFDFISASWQELETQAKLIPGLSPKLSQIVSIHSIDHLIRRDWVVNLDRVSNQYHTDGGFGVEDQLYQEYTLLTERKIFLLPVLQGYQRDLSLFHGMVHAILGKKVEVINQNHFLVEWMARQARANPILLQKAVLGFSLEPQIYDGVSLKAFYEECGFDKMPFSQMRADYFEMIKNKVLMD